MTVAELLIAIGEAKGWEQARQLVRERRVSLAVHKLYHREDSTVRSVSTEVPSGTHMIIVGSTVYRPGYDGKWKLDVQGWG
jgi:hypothetical protein